MNIPPWWAILNTDEKEWSKNPDGKYQVNKYKTLKSVAPGLFDACGQEVKEFNDYHRLNGNSFDKGKLGRKIASIPALDYFLHPELAYDNKALAAYLETHPEFKAERYSKTGNLADGVGFDAKKSR